MNLHAFINSTPPRETRAITIVEEDWFAEIQFNQTTPIQPAPIAPIQPAPIINQQLDPSSLITLLTDSNQINTVPTSTIMSSSSVSSTTTNHNQIIPAPTSTITSSSSISSTASANQHLNHHYKPHATTTVHQSTIGTSTDHINSYITSTQTIINTNTISTQTITAVAPTETINQNSFGKKASASKCPVCYDKLASMDSGLVKILPCLHIMCSNCIHGIMAFTKPPFLCPLCRDEFIFTGDKTLILP